MDLFTAQTRFVFIFGTPGAGKGTLCAKLASDPAFHAQHIHHLSPSDHLRQRKKEGSLPADIAAAVGRRVTLPAADLVRFTTEKLARECANGYRMFLLDGFPRDVEQMLYFLVQFPATFAIFVDCPAEVALKRYLLRTDPLRTGDDEALFRKRHAKFAANNPGLIAPFEAVGRLVRVDNGVSGPCMADEVYQRLKSMLVRHPVVGELFATEESAREVRL